MRLGLHLIRGENVVLLGRIDPEREAPPSLRLVPEAQIRLAQKAEREADRLRGTMRSRFDFLEMDS